MDDLAARKLVEVGRGEERAIAVAPDLPLTRAVEAFVAAVRSGSADVSSLELGVRVVETLERCEASLSSRHSKK
jgi:predicted dehydrogenase